MRQALNAMGLLILLTAIKAGVWIANHGTPSFSGSAGDIAGLVFVILLAGAFVTCLILHLTRGTPRVPSPLSPSRTPSDSPTAPPQITRGERGGGSMQL